MLHLERNRKLYISTRIAYSIQGPRTFGVLEPEHGRSRDRTTSFSRRASRESDCEIISTSQVRINIKGYR